MIAAIALLITGSGVIVALHDRKSGEKNRVEVTELSDLVESEAGDSIDYNKGKKKKKKENNPVTKKSKNQGKKKEKKTWRRRSPLDEPV